ncbi:MAG: 4-hydroxy-3-methylbut-2-enyl diphosphate reductase [Candidatus Omnitrophica bacterium]|nr:4-hydroxy-3-methylbut-2-enyl diphosphate reductase [Candidatus Omnitrophota bacterium]MDD5654521.1 4-hydroxy-3-methylbut-2-enyl diphosphate reductase [Candidatus Omnitrophota bacterium]
MKITLAKSAGFCFGVKRAIDIAFKAASSGEKVYMLGDIVHNEDVVRQIRKSGIRKISGLTRGRSKALLIRAHGADLATLNLAARLGYKIIDATCPMVKEIQNIAHSMEEKGCQVIIIGDKKHDEVRGIVGHLKGQAVIIDSAQDLPLNKLKAIKKAAVVVQSTQNMDLALKIVESLKKIIPELLFFNTICKPTRIRQEEIKKMPLENDVIIIIGSKKSANTKRLHEIAASLNRKSYWITSKNDIRRDWFTGARKVGITAGASTPDSTTRDIIEYIKQL